MAFRLILQEIDMYWYLKKKFIEKVAEDCLVDYTEIDSWFRRDRFKELDSQEVNMVLNLLIKEGFIASWRSSWGGDPHTPSSIGFMRLSQEKPDQETLQLDATG